MERFRSAKTAETKARENQPEKKVRGRPFAPGNPGRPPGSKNGTTKVLEQLMAGDAEKVVQKAVELASAGNATCLRLLFDRLLPRRNGRPVDFSLPTVSGIHDVVTTAAAIVTAVGDGHLTTAEADQLMSVLERFVKISKMPDLIDRLDAIELRLEQRP